MISYIHMETKNIEECFTNKTQKVCNLNIIWNNHGSNTKNVFFKPLEFLLNLNLKYPHFLKKKNDETKKGDETKKENHKNSFCKFLEKMFAMLTQKWNIHVS